MPLQHLRSSTANKRPTPASMSDGQLAINTNLASPGLFFKDSNGALVKVGPVHVGTTAPNASPAVGGQAGNSVGEQWLDTSSSRYVFKVWDGTAWRSESGEFVDASGDVMTGALGIIAGSAGAPGLYFSGDTNTGIYSPAADQLALSTGGTGRVIVDSAGGVTLPTCAIGLSGSTVYKTNDTGGLILYGGTNGLGANIELYGSTSGNPNLAVHDADEHRFRSASGGSERLRIDSSGNVGIGTSSPDLRLTIQEASTGSCINLLSSDGNPGGRIGTSGEATTSNGLILNANRGSGSIQLQVASIERARIDSSGRLLVGATAMPAGNFGGFGNNYIQVFNSSSIASYAALSTINDYFGSNLFLGKARSTSAGIVQNNDIVGQIVFAAADGVDHASAAGVISCRIDGTPGADDTPGRLVFSTTADGASSPTERLRIDSSGRVGIGTSSPSQLLHVNGNSLFGGSPAAQYSVVTVASDLAIQAAAPLFNFVNAAGSTRFAYINHTGTSGDFFILNQEAGSLRLGTNNSERARIDSSGRLLVGTSSARNFSNGVTTPRLQLEGLDVSTSSFGLARNSANTGGPFIGFGKSRGADSGSMTIVASGDDLGRIQFQGADGVQLQQAAEILAQVDGTPGTNDMPGRLVFSTTADGASSPTERLRIDSSGNASFAGTGALKLHAGTTAERPGTPTTGMVRYNSSITQFEGYNGSAWGTIGGGAKGAGSDQVFFENDQTVTTSYTITAGKNAMSAGPVTIGSGVTVTVPSGSVWVVV